MNPQLREKPRGLFEVTVVRCCFCPHAVEGITVAVPHDLMERHYREEHAALIARFGYPKENG